jgi:hypothetical protein
MLALSGAFCTGLVLLVAWLLEWDVGRAMTLAPLFVITFGAAAGVAVVLGRAALESMRAVRRPRLVWSIVGVGIVLVIVLSLLGVELPREG